MAEIWTTLKVLDWTTGRFEQAGIESPRLEAQILLAHALSCKRMDLYMNFDKPLGARELDAYRALIKRRLAREPVAYLVGEKEFWSLPFAVEPDVLIPRPDTETLIQLVLDEISDRAAPLRIADIATGSGAIAITLARELPAAGVIATDLSQRAAEIATHNAERNQVADRVEVRIGDLLAPLAKTPALDVIVSNPPYIPSRDLDTLPAEVRREPRMALDGGPDGLAILRRLIGESADHLLPGGLIAVEHGFDQAEAVRRLMAETGAYEPADTRSDLGGNPRVTFARKRRAD